MFYQLPPPIYAHNQHPFPLHVWRFFTHILHFTSNTLSGMYRVLYAVADAATRPLAYPLADRFGNIPAAYPLPGSAPTATAHLPACLVSLFVIANR